MGKKLSEMTLEELWQLFPIILCAHRECWGDWYREESQKLAAILPRDAIIHHIGSTAIPGIWAKPIVDILVEVPAAAFLTADSAVLGSGYLCMCAGETRRDYNKGYTENGFAERVFHLHLRITGDHDELYFRDYLTEHPAIAKEYEKLKLSLLKKYEHNRDGYTAAKGGFVTKWTETAKRTAFRQAEAGDLQAVYDLYQSAIGDDFCVWNASYPGWQEIRQDSESGGLYVLEENGRIAGAVSVVPENELDGLPFWKIRDICVRELARVVVARDCRGRGLSLVMVNRLLDILERRGCRSVHLAAATANLPALRTYQSAGFTEVGACEMYGNRYYLFEKALNPKSAALPAKTEEKENG